MEKTTNKVVEIFAIYIPKKVVFTLLRKNIQNIRIHKNQ